jgi:N,N'-diacetylchitobiose transport system permease protein
MTNVIQPEIAPVPVAPAVSWKKRPFYQRKGFSKALWNTLAMLLFVVFFFPVYWMVSSSFKRPGDILKFPPDWFPIHATLFNYKQAVNCKLGSTQGQSGVICQQGFWSSVTTSLVIVAVVVAISMTLAFLAAVAIAKFKFGARRAFIVLVVFIQLLPGAGLLIPIYLSYSTTFKGLHLLHNLSGVIIGYLVFTIPFSIWLLRGFIMNIPKDLEEAAMVDGATQLGAFVRILLPLVAPGIVAASIYAFISTWNEWLFASTMLGGGSGGGKETLMMFLYQLGGGNQGIPYGTIMATSTLAALPVVIFFIAVQRRVAFGLTSGAVRG